MTQLPTDEIDEQQRLLDTYRRTLAIYLRQAAALGGMAHSPPAVVGGIDEARHNIARIKAILRRAGVDVADDPDDSAADDWVTAQPKHAAATPLAIPPAARRSLRWIVLAGAGLAAIAVLFVLIRAISPPPPQLVIVQGHAMEPTLSNGQQVTIEPVEPTDLRRGDVVLISPFGEAPYFKRIIGLPDETVRIQDDRVYIDGDPLAETYVLGPTTCQPDGLWCSAKLMPGTVYVLGDNRTNSSDSREYGPVLIAKIQGRVP